MAHTDTKAETGRREEIEITPAMIEAGVPLLFDYDPRFSNEKEIVAAIFEAMTLAARV
jgi:hypothetical protein